MSQRLHVEPVMGTTVTVDCRDDALDETATLTAIRAAVDVLHGADRAFSTYRSDSAVSRLRRGELGERDCPPVLRDVLGRCRQARETTRGWFDPWRMPGGVDPTGLVKGWAAQQALAVLREHGCGHACVNAGGDVAVIGFADPVIGRAWSVGVVDPHFPPLLHTTLPVRAAIATSGGYERGSLAIDPSTQRGVARLASASVLADDLAAADAYATAATAHGPDALDWLGQIPGVAALLLMLDGTVLTTPRDPRAHVRARPVRGRAGAPPV